jgi:hypothetical protein
MPPGAFSRHHRLEKTRNQLSDIRLASACPSRWPRKRLQLAGLAVFVWERLRYDWSDPDRVVMTTTDSSVWGGRSSDTYTFTRLPDGTTDLDAVVVREGKNIMGGVLGFVLGTIGRRVLEKAFANTIKAIEARNGAAREGGAS